MSSFTKYLLTVGTALALASCDGANTDTTPPEGAEMPEAATEDVHPLSLIEMTRFGGVETEGFHNCFWIGPANYESYNIAYPDEGAVYWGARFELPDNASHLELEGKYPKARYFSFNTYDKQTQPIYALADVGIGAKTGANPYTSGDKSGGTYVVKVKSGEAGTAREANTLYLGSKERNNIDLPLIWRIYVPDAGTDYTGGAGLPEATLVLKDGSRHTGDTMCHMIGSPLPEDGVRTVPTVTMKEEVYRKLVTSPDAPKGFPGQEQIDWSLFWGGDINISRYIPGHEYYNNARAESDAGTRPKKSGFYANIDNDYVSAFVSEVFGEIVVLEGKMPRIPSNGWEITEGEYDLRYWSLCTNEHIVTTKYADCKFDKQITLDEDRNYRIVISKEKKRPENATKACGVTWLDWGENGDGAGDTSQSYLLIRNMMGDGFANSIQNVKSPLTVGRDMGAFLPKATYSSKAEFEAKECGK